VRSRRSRGDRLEVARRLAGLQLPGAVKFAFQPAEEVSNGANAMIADGVLDNPTVHAALACICGTSCRSA